MKNLTYLIVLLFLGNTAFGQEQKMMDASEIANALERFNTLGSVLYLAAHPDDENTRLISYLSKDKKYRTAYLSLTRGDGGQNLIGDEKGALLGLIRTQELLEARKRDGGEQFFTRAVDFGYSKTAEESFEKWNKNEVLADVVFVIRKFQPDVIVTRFNPEGYNGHGHHTASALLAEEAFDLAGDKTAFPEQLKHVEVWQPKRLYFNSSSWWDKNLEEKAKNNPDYLVVDVGAYDVFSGKWINEIAAESRSQHKSQGFGVSKWKGEMLEYLRYLKGDKADKNLMSGIKTDWSRLQGGAKIKGLMDEIIANYDFKNPGASTKDLLRVYQVLLEDIPEGSWKNHKLKALEDLILSTAGIWIDAFSNKASISSKDAFRLNVSVLNSGELPLKINSVVCGGRDTGIGVTAEKNKLLEFSMGVKNTKKEPSQSYWLKSPYENLFDVKSYDLLSKPENDPEFKASIHLDIAGKSMNISRRVNYKWTTRVEGERYKDFIVAPDFSINTAQKLEIFSGNNPKKISVKVKAHRAGLSGTLKPIVPRGWKIEPSAYEVYFQEEGESDYLFELTPPFVAQSAELGFELRSEEGLYNRGFQLINYDHIKEQVHLPEAKVQLIRLDVLHRIRKLAYIEGAGDEVVESIERMGIKVDILDLSSIGTIKLNQYDAIITGVRAYNTQKSLKFLNTLLLDYVFEGGNLIVQYNTNSGLVTEDIGPNPFTISRSRVSVEEAKPRFLIPDHPILNAPNQITQTDFDNWVQERGLYFAQDWSEDYQAIIGWNDPGEEELAGALIVCPHGKGNFIYTGISFFRQLPAGVPGAFRLFANIISYRR